MIELHNIAKAYARRHEPTIKAIDNVSLKIEQGEFVAILGPSGSGKTTLMNVMGLLDRPDAGDYKLGGRDIFKLSDNELAGIRSSAIGFVFQAYHLLPRTTALENVQLAMLYSDEHGDVHKSESEAALREVGLGDRMTHFASELSGGQQQRVAIARAIVKKPSVILADEPTGNLDQAAQGEIMQLFKAQNAKGTTIVLVTHNMEVANQARRVITVRDGSIASDVNGAGLA